ncbi:hypothetical protein R5L70_18280 [Acinetobacter bereziniae]|nr:hypothetical protein [Acinetobacter bereziniae]MDV8157477.1 hypothetical protein [Acinetobacter bereziniae]
MSWILPDVFGCSGHSGKALKVLWNVFSVLHRGHLISIESNVSLFASSLKQQWHLRFFIAFFLFGKNKVNSIKIKMKAQIYNRI